MRVDEVPTSMASLSNAGPRSRIVVRPLAASTTMGSRSEASETWMAWSSTYTDMASETAKNKEKIKTKHDKAQHPQSGFALFV